MFDIQIVNFEKEDEKRIRAIRDEVFIKEQGFTYEIEYDGKDESAIHALLFCDNKTVGTGRMLSDGRIGRVAILKEYRKKGLGKKIVEAFIKEALNNSYKRVYLSAQHQAISFYEKLGFITFGDEYLEGEISHIKMQKILT